MGMSPRLDASLEAGADAEAIDARHHGVQQYEVRGAGGHRVERRGPRGCRGDAISLRLQIRYQQSNVEQVVVHNHDVGWLTLYDTVVSRLSAQHLFPYTRALGAGEGPAFHHDVDKDLPSVALPPARRTSSRIEETTSKDSPQKLWRQREGPAITSTLPHLPASRPSPTRRLGAAFS